MAENVRVLIVDDAPRTVDNLKRLLAFEPDIEVVGTAGNAFGGIQAAHRLMPDMVLMDVNLPDMDGIRATRVLGAEMPLLPVVMISVQEDREYLRQAMQAGAREYLVKPFSADELVSAIRRVSGQEARKRAHGTVPPEAARRSAAPAAQPVPDTEALPPKPGGGRIHVPSVSWAAAAPPVIPDIAMAPAAVRRAAAEAAASILPAPSTDANGTASGHPGSGVALSPAAPEPELPPVPPPLEPRPGRGQVIAVFSGRGGVGKSTVAVNLAATIAKETGADVALVDLDLQFGDIAVMLGVEPAGTIADVAEMEGLAYASVGALMPMAPGGVRVLAAPLRPELADLVSAEHVKAVTELLRSAFDHIILDLSSHIDDVALEGLENADRIVLLTDLQLPGLKQTKLAYQLFDGLKIPRDRVLLVLNMADTQGRVTPGQASSNIGARFAARIPTSERLVVQAVEKAVPVVEAFPDSDMAEKFRELAASLVRVPAAGRQQKPGRRRLFGRTG